MAPYSVPISKARPAMIASRRLRAAASGRAAGFDRPNSGRKTTCQASRLPSSTLAAIENHQRPTAVSGANCASDDVAVAALTSPSGTGPMISG
jgi:hypothetical protein